MTGAIASMQHGHLIGGGETAGGTVRTTVGPTITASKTNLPAPTGPWDTWALIGVASAPPLRNLVPNSINNGAAVGTPGTLPTTWSTFVGAVTGLTFNVSALAVDATTGLKYIDIAVSGTPVGSGNPQINLDSKFSASVLTYTGSCYMALIAGALPIGFSCQWSAWADASTFLSAPGSVFPALTAALQPVIATAAAPATTTLASMYLVFTATNGTPISFTVRIAGVQFEAGSVNTAFQLTPRTDFIPTKNGVVDPSISGATSITYNFNTVYWRDGTNYWGWNTNSALWQSTGTSITQIVSSTPTLAITPISTQTVNTTFAVSGTVAGISPAPTLQYRDLAGVWNAWPVGSPAPTTTTFTFTHPAIAVANAAMTVSVRDANNVSTTATSNTFTVAATGLAPLFGFVNGDGSWDVARLNEYEAAISSATADPPKLLGQYIGGFSETFANMAPTYANFVISTWQSRIVGTDLVSPIPCLGLLLANAPFVSSAQSNQDYLDVTNGNHDAEYNAVFTAYKNAGFSILYIRIAWEYQFSAGYPWLANYGLANWLSAWRRVAELAHAFVGMTIKTVWNPSEDFGGATYTPLQSYPSGVGAHGDYVDYIGLDTYGGNGWDPLNTAANSFGVQNACAFAVARNKPIIFAEVGSAYGGGPTVQTFCDNFWTAVQNVPGVKIGGFVIWEENYQDNSGILATTGGTVTGAAAFNTLVNHLITIPGG